MTSRSSGSTPLSDERKKNALSYLIWEQRWRSLSQEADFDAVASPTDYTASKRLQKDIDAYFTYKIEYFNLYDANLYGESPFSWVYYADIHDEIVEQKFKVDQDIRGYITAFRLTVESNRRSIIIWKRAMQALVTSIGYLPLLLGGVSFWWGLLGPLGLVILAYLGQTQMLDLPLRQVTLTCGTRLTKKIQLRVGNLNQAFQFYMRQIDAEERVRDISDAEWTHRSAWWMKLSMWVPKRVEYIEKFLQTEMQRTRIFMLWSGTVGRLIAMAIVLIGAVLALSFVATRSGVAFGAMLNPSVWLPVLATASVSMWAGWRVLRSDNYFVAALAASLAALFAVFVWATGMALNPTSPDLFWLAIGALVSVVVARASIESSVSLSDIATALTKEPLGLNSRFADIRLHDELGEQIRKDKETIRQERLRGGGIGQGGGRP